MFIKKDLRKIPRILEEAPECDVNDEYDEATRPGDEPRGPKRPKTAEPLSRLRLGRRQQEFQGSIRVLCQPSYLPKLQHLKNLNLYDCGLEDLTGIGLLGNCPSLEVLNFGRNPLPTLPDELAELAPSLKELWLDDCRLEGELPGCIEKLANLELLRLPNNQISTILAGVAQLPRLRVLCLDRNPLGAAGLPDLSAAAALEEVFLRHTGLTELPGLPTSARILHLSSNPGLRDLSGLVPPDGPVCPKLERLYANGCGLASLPERIVSAHPALERLVVSHNPSLTNAPEDFWGAVRAGSGEDSNKDGGGPTILWQPNPLLRDPEAIDEDDDSDEEEDDSDDSDDDDSEEEEEGVSSSEDETAVPMEGVEPTME